MDLEAFAQVTMQKLQGSRRKQGGACGAAGPGVSAGLCLGRATRAHAGPHAWGGRRSTRLVRLRRPDMAHSGLPYGPAASVRSREHLCRVITWIDAMLTQNGPQPHQLSVHPGEFTSQRQAASIGLRPLVLSGSSGGAPLLLLIAPRDGNLEILPIDRGFLLSARLRDLLVQVLQVRPHAHPALDRC